MVKFEVGKTYYTRSSCDHNCIIKVEIVARTEKTVTAKVSDKAPAKFRPSIDRGAEGFMPWGRGSMMPFIEATDTQVLRPDWEKETAAA